MQKNPNLKNQKSRESLRRPRNNIPPLELRKRGISSQAEFIFTSLPYMEWVKYTDFIQYFWQYFPHVLDQNVRSDKMGKLVKRGLIEKKYEGEPPLPGKNGGKGRPCKYLWVRRIAKDYLRPTTRAVAYATARLNGTYGAKAAAEAQNKKPRPEPKHTMTTLTAEHVAYIRQNPDNLTQEILAQMFGTFQQKICKIVHGYLPQHLRGRPSQ